MQCAAAPLQSRHTLHADRARGSIVQRDLADRFGGEEAQSRDLYICPLIGRRERGSTLLTRPHSTARFPEGLDDVFVNGTRVLAAGSYLPRASAGRVLRA